MLPRQKLNKTELSVSVLCYGTNMLGTAADQAHSNALLDTFVELGGNFIDTARSYGDWISTAPKGASERAIGQWLKNRRRADLVVATKGGFMDLRAGDWAPRVKPAAIEQDLKESLDHLQTEYIDLYWLHSDDPSQPVSAIVDCLVAQQKAGRIRHFGASNWSPQRILEAQEYARSIKHEGFVAIQPFWGLAVPNREAAAQQGYAYYYEDGFQALHAGGLTMVPYAGQSNGFFSKLAQSGEAALSESLAAKYLNDANRARLTVVKAIAQARGAGINEVVLAYLLCQPNQTIPIIGASRPEQLRDSVKAVNVKLSSDELRKLAAGT